MHGKSDAEQRAGTLLIGQAFFVGLAFGLLYNVAYTSLVYDFGSAGLRIVYMLVGIVIPIATVGFNALEERLQLSQLLLFTYSLFAASIFAMYALTLLPDAPWTPFVIMVTNTMGGLYCMMLRGAQAAELYDTRTLKRKYPRITGGEILAVIIAGTLVSPLSVLLGSLDLVILVAGGAMLVAVALAHYVSSYLLRPMERAARLTKVEAGSASHEHGFSALRAIIGKRYTLTVFGFQVASSMTSLLVKYLIYSEAQTIFAAQADLSRFIGYVQAGATGLGFLFLTFAAGRLLVKFGMPTGLLGSPIAVGAILIGALVTASTNSAGGAAFFAVLVAARLVDYTLYSGFAKTSVQNAFQPLPHHEREAVHTFVQGIGIPFSYGLTGLLLTAFAQASVFSTVEATYVTLAAVLLYGAIATFLFRAYAGELRHALSRRHLSAVDLTIDDSSTLSVVDRLLRSDDPTQVRGALQLLQDSGHRRYESSLAELIEHPDPSVRLDVYERLETSAPQWASKPLGSVVSVERDPDVQAAALRALCATVEDPATEIGSYLDAESMTVRAAVVSGLFLYGGINGVLRAGEVFNKMVASADPEERASSADILYHAGIRSFYHPLLRLLDDTDVDVARAALRAAQRVAHPALLEKILPWIDPPETRAYALRAFVSLGQPAVELLRRCLEGTGEQPRNRSLRIIRSGYRIEDSQSVQILESALQHGDPEIAEAVYQSLSRRGYSAPADVRPVIVKLIHTHCRQAACAATARLEVSVDPRLTPLSLALEERFHRSWETVFLLLTFLYNPDDILGIRRKLVGNNAKQIALGVELLDVELSNEVKQYVIPVAVPPTRNTFETSGYAELFRITMAEPVIRVAEILEQPEQWPDHWLQVCARHAAAILGIQADPLEEDMITTIERVVTLKQADIFSSIQDSVLAHIASVAEDIEVSAGETFIRQGELGKSLYIIRSGKVAVYKGQAKLATLEDGAVVGEMAVLDPEPRSATVTAVEDSSLLRIDKDSFDSVMEDHPDIAQSVIHVLCTRLRGSSQ